MRFRTAESRVVAVGGVGLAAVAATFLMVKLASWSSFVVHEERTSIHRQFPGGVVLRFPQEALNMADLLTGTFLTLAGVCALAIAFGMTERLRSGKATNSTDARRVRGFFRLAGFGLVWLGLDEAFLIHEFLSANLYVHDAAILGVYGVIALFTVAVYQRVLRTSRVALSVLAAGAALHAAALGFDVLQDHLGWVPEEPFEMLAAGLYALAVATYAARLLLASPGYAATTFFATAHAGAPVARNAVLPLPDDAIEPLMLEDREPQVMFPPDPAWTH